MFCSVGISVRRNHGWKGNRVKVPNSPAAVNSSVSTFVYRLQGHCLSMKDGKARQTGVSQKTCKTKSCSHSRGKDGKNVRNVELQLKFKWKNGMNRLSGSGIAFLYSCVCMSLQAWEVFLHSRPIRTALREKCIRFRMWRWACGGRRTRFPP